MRKKLEAVHFGHRDVGLSDPRRSCARAAPAATPLPSKATSTTQSQRRPASGRYRGRWITSSRPGGREHVRIGFGSLIHLCAGIPKQTRLFPELSAETRSRLRMSDRHGRPRRRAQILPEPDAALGTVSRRAWREPCGTTQARRILGNERHCEREKPQSLARRPAHRQGPAGPLYHQMLGHPAPWRRRSPRPTHCASCGGFLHLLYRAGSGGGRRAGGARPGGLRNSDLPREHAHAYAKGMTAKSIIAELFGKSTRRGAARCTCWSAEKKLHPAATAGLVPAGAVPVAARAHLGLRRCKTQRRSGSECVSLAMAPSPQGAFHEGVALAALWRLPVVFLCENNLLLDGDAALPVALGVGRVGKGARLRHRARRCLRWRGRHPGARPGSPRRSAARAEQMSFTQRLIEESGKV